MFGTGELLLILAVAFLLFGGKKLPELARGLGRGIREFKLACQGIAEEDADRECQPADCAESELKVTHDDSLKSK